MIEKVKALVNKDEKYKKVLSAVYENPYSELKILLKHADSLDSEGFTTVLEELTREFIVVELTTQADSNIESRVPKKIYLINPDIEEELENIL